MGIPKPPSPSHPAGEAAATVQPPAQGMMTNYGSRGSTGGSNPAPQPPPQPQPPLPPQPPSMSPVALAGTSSPQALSTAHAAAPSSPPNSLTKRSDSGSAGGAAATAAGGESGPDVANAAPPNQHKYTKRSSDSGGGLGGSTGLGFPVSPPAPKGASVSGVPLVTLPQASASHQQQQQASAGRRLQQLGQRLNFGLTLGRKKHATFAPGLSAGGGNAGSGPLTYPEDVSGGGGGCVPAAISFASTAAMASGHGAAVYGPHAGGAFGASSHGSGRLTAEEFNPPNHPVNPFSYLATPFRVMARTKAGVAMGRYASTALRLKRDGVPPASYMWLWLGNFKRWHRRYFVASEAPGVLLIYKRANMKGKVLSTSLCDATVVQDDFHPRQIRLETPLGTIFLRVLRPEERQPWIACLRASQQEYRKHKEVVDTLAAAAAGEGGEAACAVAGALPSVASVAVEQDLEQRRRIRVHLNDRLAELAPLVSEVERHLGLVGQLLADAAAGIGHLTSPLLQNIPVMQLSGRSVRSPGAGDGHGPHLPTTTALPTTTTLATTTAATITQPVATSAATGPPSVYCLGWPSAGGTGRRAEIAGGGLLQEKMGPMQEFEAAVQDREGPLSRSRNRNRGAPSPSPTVHSPTLSAAVAALVDACRSTLHNEAVRIATLEAENAALNSSLNFNFRAQASTHRNAARARGVSTPGLHAAASTPASTAAASVWPQLPGRGSAIPTAAATAGAAATAAAPAAALALGTLTGSASGGAAAASGVVGGAIGIVTAGDDAASEGGSACTADEDAFDVVEAFDDGVDYSILDDDAPHLHHRLGVDDYEQPYVQHGNYPSAADEEESDEDAEEDAEELAQQAEVLNALEVVRQVEYITANDNNAQLKTLLTADTPPPPDAEEDEEEAAKGKRKSRGKGEDTDATLDDEDDDDSEGAVSSGGAGGTVLVRRPYAGRSRLPAPKPLGRGFSIWSILKNMIGRDLTKITMPATINEPLSMTQRMAEVLENRSLLERACTTPDSVDRLMLVSCWLLAGYNSQPLRDNKPFNPLLGETFEWQAPNGSARYLCEQVSHHPPVSCFVAEGAGPQGYELYGEVETKTKFWGKTIDCILAGHMSLRIKAFEEEYRFNLGTLVINDIILGRFWIDLSCDMKVRNQQTGDAARLIIKPCRGYPYLKERGKCEGLVCDAEGREVWRISGSSMNSLFAALTPEAAAARGAEPANTEPQLIWSKEPELPNPTEQYCMTRFALGLNDPADPVVPHLPPTDARFRPDMRALELGEWKRATSEKVRLEEKQRAVRRLRNEAGQGYQPRWFKQVLFNTKDATHPAIKPGSVWQFTNEYWDARERKDWGELPDIY